MKMKFTLLLICFTSMISAQKSYNFWTEVAKSDLEKTDVQFNAKKYRTLSLDVVALKKYLQNAPLENTTAAKNRPLFLHLPMPDGTFTTFEVTESQLMEPGLAKRYSSIKTFIAKSVENSTVKARFSYSPSAFYGAIYTLQGNIFIDPFVNENTTYYAAYYTKDEIVAPKNFACGYKDEMIQMEEPAHNVLITPRSSAPVALRKYRLAVATSGEFAQQFGVTSKGALMDLVVNIVNRVNGVFENDAAIRFVLAEKTDSTFYLDPMTDPFISGSNIGQTYSQTGAVLNRNIGLANYDIGHSFIAGCGSGVVGLGGGRVCNNNSESGSFKGLGASCVFTVTNSSIEIVAHEMGHQFSAQHSWSNCPTNQDQLVSSSAFEPGSGTTVMSYSGSCGAQNVQGSSDAYFHTKSLEEIISYSRVGAGAGCGTQEGTTNEEPVVTLNYKNNFYIPISTPFELTANATDANGDALTYCWEQFDLGPTTTLGAPIGDAPSFRSFPPVTSPTRVFPTVQTIIANTSSNVEVLPTYDRNLTFRCTVRDNRRGGGVSVWKQVRFKSTSAAGPFLVLHPNEDTVVWTAGTYAEVRWDVAKTNNNLVNCRFVTIKLSTNGGLTYPITLVKGVPNNGKALVPVPDLNSRATRVRVEADDNIFFDISNQSFRIAAATQPSYVLNVTPRSIRDVCLPQSLQFTVNASAFGGFDKPITLQLEGVLPPYIQAVFSKTTILPTESATVTFTFTQQVQQEFNFQIKGTSSDGSTVSIPIYFSTISSDFSALKLLTPANGQSGLGLITDFKWSKINNAQFYEFELATSPAFGATTIVNVSNLTDTLYRPTIQFDENKLYFWRIRPVNACGVGTALEPFAFHTSNIECAKTASTNVPVNISGTGLPTINSTVNITTQGTITDVNVPLIKANYPGVRSLRFTLISPKGTEVILFNQSCGNTLRFETGFDDDAPTAITCPPDDKLVVRPSEALAAFKNETTLGTWTLRTRVVTAGSGGGGSLESWNIEFCSNLTLQNPLLIKNDTLKVPPGKTNTYTVNQLEVRDPDNTPAQLKYTLVTLPKHGSLTRGGTTLQLGNTFTQQEVTNFQLKYTHNGDSATGDSYTFVVEDGTGGWLPIQRAFIKIDPNATVGVNDILSDSGISVFPNPTRDVLNVQFERAPKGGLTAILYNVQGQEALRERFDNANNGLQINTIQLPSGMYFLTLRTAEGIATKKVTIQR